jgi:DMSO/TMAO reductase YedYZ molybdopterin-dependent catalytic subunit
MSGSTRAGFWAGIVAGGIAVTAIYLGLFTSGIPAVALALWDRMMQVIPMQLFAFFIVRLKFAAKPSAFWGMLLGLVIVWGIFGAILARARFSGAVRAAVAWIASAGVLGLLAYGPAVAGLAARRAAQGSSDGSAGSVALAIAAYAAIFSLVYAVLLRMMTRRTPVASSGEGVSRRELLSRAVWITIATTVGAGAARWVQTAAQKTTALAQTLIARFRDLLPSEITPNERFYIVSKNPPGFDPVLDERRWSLDVGGMVARPMKLTYDQLRALPAVDQLQTLECISNEVGGDLISNAKWKGVRLRDVLQRAGGPSARAIKVAFHCADGYTESIPVADAVMPTTLLAYEMNGERLPPSHGFPLRLLVPGLFGMKNPKWITRIELVDYDFQGYWERSGWSDEAVVKTMSKFTTLGRSYKAGEEIGVGGVAYAGDRGVKEVEVSTDGGKTWQKAEVKSPLGPFTWVLWASLWQPTAPDEYVLKVRAKDGLGVTQIAKDTATLPDGASGYHTVRVRVRK